MLARSSFFLFSLFTCFPELAAASSQPLAILIDPGHGGRDHGTERNGVTEASITLKVAHLLFERLRHNPHFQPRLTRQNEDGVSLQERVRQARDKKADLFLSIHVNSSPDVKARGAEFYFQNQMAPDEESMFLAHQENEQANGGSPATSAPSYAFFHHNRLTPEIATILTDLFDYDRIMRSSELAKVLKQTWHATRKGKSNGIRQAPFYVLNQITTPSALVELGFLTNNEDFRDLTETQGQNKMAEDLYRGLIQYRESITNRNASR